MATDACLSLRDVCVEDRLAKSQHTEDCTLESQLLNTTPEREDEGKRRRRLVSDPSSQSCSRGTAPSGGNGASSRSSSLGHCSTAGSSPSLSCPDPPPISKGVEDMLRAYLASWGQRLVQLQPKVYLTEHLIECGLYLFKYLRHLQTEACCEGKFPLQYLSNEQLLIHDLVACWWVALKHCSVRTAVPNRTLMCCATGTSPELLSDRELAALIAIDWEVQAVLKQSGLVR